MAGLHQMLLGSGFRFSPVISTVVVNFNLRAAAIAAGWDQVSPLKAIVTVASTGVVGSASTGGYAFDTGAGFPAGSDLKLINTGYIVGAGGNGAWAYYPASAGFAGGPALRAQYPIVITNTGVIGGGGGGGGYGQVDGAHAGYAGGGAGCVPGAGGVYSDGGTMNNPGTLAAGGPGYQGGGSGGALGANGGSGSNFGSQSRAGGAAGAAVVGNANVTWVATGTRYGSVG